MAVAARFRKAEARRGAAQRQRPRRDPRRVGRRKEPAEVRAQCHGGSTRSCEAGGFLVIWGMKVI